MPHIWMSTEEFYNNQHYSDTVRRLEAVLELATEMGVTGPEIASITASLHARAIARLNPNDEQRHLVLSVLNEAIITLQEDSSKNGQPTTWLTSVDPRFKN